jgi:hypothetical protein
MSEPELQPISPEDAQSRLDQAIRQHLGDDWQDPRYRWTTVSSHNYMARLTDGTRKIDFYVDLLGKVTIEEQTTVTNTDNTRFIIGIIIGTSLFVAYLIARFAGLI